jgi:hypothetical protein
MDDTPVPKRRKRRARAPELGAILQVTPEVLCEVFQLPRGAYIDRVDNHSDHPGVLYLRIRGAGWPMTPGAFIPRATGQLTKAYGSDGKASGIVIDWGLPSHPRQPAAPT